MNTPPFYPLNLRFYRRIPESNWFMVVPLIYGLIMKSMKFLQKIKFSIIYRKAVLYYSDSDSNTMFKCVQSCIYSTIFLGVSIWGRFCVSRKTMERLCDMILSIFYIYRDKLKCIIITTIQKVSTSLSDPLPPLVLLTQHQYDTNQHKWEMLIGE